MFQEVIFEAAKFKKCYIYVIIFFSFFQKPGLELIQGAANATNTARNVGSPVLSGSPRPNVSTATPQVTTPSWSPSPQSTLTGSNAVANNMPQANVGGGYQASQAAGAIQGQNLSAAGSCNTNTTNSATAASINSCSNNRLASPNNNIRYRHHKRTMYHSQT